MQQDRSRWPSGRHPGGRRPRPHRTGASPAGSDDLGGESLFRALAASLPDTLVLVVDPELRVVLVDGALPRRAPWFTPEQFCGRELEELVAALRPDIVPEVLAHHRAALAGEHRRFEVLTDRRAFSVDVVPLLCGGDPDSRRDGDRAALTLAREVTGTAPGGPSDLTVPIAPEAVVHAAPDGRIVAVSSGCEELFGYPEQELAGRPLELLSPARVRGWARQLIRRALAGERVTGDGYIGCRRDGSEFPTAYSLSPILDGDDRIIGLSAVLRDLTPRPA